MERWIVSSWNCNRANISEVVFEGSKDHCQQHARDLLRKLPLDMDCMAMAESDWKLCQQLSGNS